MRLGTLGLEKHFSSDLRLRRGSTSGVMLHFDDLYFVVCGFVPHLTEGQVGSNSDDLIILSDGLWISKEHVSWLHIKFSLPSIQENGEEKPKDLFPSLPC